MKKKLFCVILSIMMLAGCIPAMAVQDGPELNSELQQSSEQSRQMEKLDRGAFGATAPSGGVYLSWRLLGSEPMDTVFNIYKNDQKLVDFINNTNYTDLEVSETDKYTIAPVINGQEGEKCEPITILAGHADKGQESVPYTYFDIPLNIPSPASDYEIVYDSGKSNSPIGGANDVSVGDVDGDGEYEIILKWDPNNSKDNSQSGKTGRVYLDCYEMDGTQLWRIDMGANIRAGAHYTQFQVYDYDGDGKAELAVKTAPGTIDGAGNYVTQAGTTEAIKSADNSASYVNSSGFIIDGPEYLTIFNGQTGAAMQTVDYDPGRGDTTTWGKTSDKTNRVDRFLACTAYLDGVHPSLVTARGYYGKAIVVAYDWDGKNLNKRWRCDSTVSGYGSLAGQGNHNVSVADLDGDGCDEIVYGSAAIDNDGTVAHSTGWGHGDAIHVSDFNNDGKQEIFGVLEEKPNWGTGFRDAAGKEIWHFKASGDDGRGVMDYFSPKYGVLAWDAAFGVRTIGGELISKTTLHDGSYPNFPIYWDGDLYREHFNGDRISKWNDDTLSFGRLWTIYTNNAVKFINSTKTNPNLQADLFGDWREEIILRHSDNSALRVFASISPTDYKFTTFMHDSQYRSAIAWQNTAYNQPPHQSYYIGYDKDISEYVQPNLYYAPLPESVVTVKDSSGNLLSGASVKIDSQIMTTDENGMVSARLLPGTHNYEVELDRYILSKGAFEVPENSGATLEVVLEAKQYIYDSSNDETGSKFVYDGSEGAALTFSSSKEWQFTQDSSDGGRSFKADFETAYGGNAELEFAFGTGGTKDAGGAWNWTGRAYTYEIKLLDSTEKTVLAIGQEYSESGANEAYYYSGTGAKTNISSGTVFGSPNITKRSSSNWRIKISLDLTNGTAKLILSDDSGENGYIIKNISIDSADFSSLEIGSIASSNVTWSPKVKDVLYWADSVTPPSPPPTLDPTKPTPTAKPTAEPTATPLPTDAPIIGQSWDFDNLKAGDIYGNSDDNNTISNNNGKSINIDFGTSAADGAVPPAITQRAEGNNYIQFTDKGAGQDGWSYLPETVLDGDKIIFEEDFMSGDTAKDTPLFRIFDSNNANPDNTYTTAKDGRVFEVMTVEGGTLKLNDYFSMGASATKPKDTQISGFSFSPNKWYSLKLEYTKSDNKVKVYTKEADSSDYTLRGTVTLGSGTKKIDEVPQLLPTKVQCSTRGSSANSLGIDNITVGVQGGSEVPEVTPTVQPASEFMYTLNSIAEAENGININLTKNKEGIGSNVIIAAAYDRETGALTAVETSDITMNVGDSSNIFVPLAVSETNEIKVFVWNSTDGIEPLSKSISK